MKTGYKQTEIGIIPDDWAVAPLRQNLKQNATYGIVKAGAFLPSGVPMLRGGDIFEGRVGSDQPYVSFEKSQEYARTVLQKGDVVIALVGYPGESAEVPDRLVGANISRAVGLLRPSAALSSDFLVSFLNSPIGRKEFLRPSAGSAQIVVNLSALNQLVVPLPSTAEQRAIAAALSDADSAIASLERLIAKKRDIKQAAMQQLLTGQTRLPGFSGEWEMKRLGEMLRVRHGKSQKFVEDSNGDYPILATGGVIGRARKPLYDKPSVLIGRKGTIDRPQFMDMPFWSVDTLFYTEIQGQSVAKFLYYRFLLIDWRRYNEASGVPSLNAKTIEDIEIAICEPEEQGAIASVLSDMDAELSALETQLKKTRLIKQAMMQELLTGRIRLPIREAVDA